MKNKAPARSPVTKVVGEGWCPDASAGESRRGEAAAVEERGRWGPHKGQPRWVWPAIDQLTGVVLAYTFGSRAQEVFVALRKWLTPFGLAPGSPAAAGV